jgi:hypothetical protein
LGVQGLQTIFGQQDIDGIHRDLNVIDERAVPVPNHMVEFRDGVENFAIHRRALGFVFFRSFGARLRGGALAVELFAARTLGHVDFGILVKTFLKAPDGLAHGFAQVAES